MKIYFAGSIRGGREDVDLYVDLIKYLQTYGEVLTEHVGDKNLFEQGERVISDREVHDRDLVWMEESDVMIAEVTTPSLGVGYEIAKAVEMGKQILCLYRPQKDRRLSGMIGGCPGVTIFEYQTLQEAEGAIRDFFARN